MSIQLLRPGKPFQSPTNSVTGGWVAVGNDLSVGRLVEAYQKGIFPWPVADMGMIPWCSPDPRMVLFPQEVRAGRKLRRYLRDGGFHITTDRVFRRVMLECARAPRGEGQGTWIDTNMLHAYSQLHESGHAHSVEVWRGDRDEERELVGGLYGVAVGQGFTGESMFHKEEHASRAALLALALFARRWGWGFVDCQVHTEHTERMGAREIPRIEFLALLQAALADGASPGRWSLELSGDDLRQEFAGWEGTVGPT
jgi:leucyl/phenylalanyl-tRNA--protein transferase